MSKNDSVSSLSSAILVFSVVNKTILCVILQVVFAKIKIDIMKCLVKCCTKNMYWDAGLTTFHSIPKHAHKTWCEILNLNVEWKQSLKICSDHFKEEDFDYTGQTVRLKSGVVPSLALLDTATPVSTISEKKESAQLEPVPGASHSEPIPGLSRATQPTAAVDDTASQKMLLSSAIKSEDTFRLPQTSDNGKQPQIRKISHLTKPAAAVDDTASQKMLLSSEIKSEDSFRLPQTSDNGEQSQMRNISHSTSPSSISQQSRFIAIIHNYSALSKPRKATWTPKQKATQWRRRLCSKQSVSCRQPKVASVKNLITHLRQEKLISENAEEHLTIAFGTLSHTLLQGEKRLVQEYSQEIKEFAMTLQFYSTKAYEYARKKFNFNLPHPTTIRRWFSGVDFTPGFTDQAFSVLKEKAAKETNKRLICSLMLNEMTLKKQIEFDGKRTWGYVDLGVGVTDDILSLASEVLVLMVVSLHDAWKLPVAYFFIKSLNGEERSNILKEALIRLKACNVEITSVTCDGPSVHFTMMKALGCEITDINEIKSYFPHPSDASILIYVLFDLCHMLNLMRICLASSGAIIDPDGNKIEWKFIQKLNELQEQEDLSFDTKLKNVHMEWHRQKMKVKLAGQTLSQSVADALAFLNNIGHPDFEGCEATIKFISIIEQLFNICNSWSPLAIGFKGPLRERSQEQWRPFLLDSVEYLKNCKATDGSLMVHTSKKTPFIGFMASTLSIIEIFDVYVLKEPALEYLLTHKLSQNHLETFFNNIRLHDGWSSNPTCLGFVHSYKSLLISGNVQGVEENCAPLDL